MKSIPDNPGNRHAGSIPASHPERPDIHDLYPHPSERLPLIHVIAQRLVREVTALYTCGPAGGGGVRTAMRPRLGTVSCLVPRDAVAVCFEMVEPAPQPLEVSP